MVHARALTWILVATFLVADAHGQDDPLSVKNQKAANDAIFARIQGTRAEDLGTRVLADGEYFLKAFKSDRQLSSGHKLVAGNQIVWKLLETVREHGEKPVTQLRDAWIDAQKELLVGLTKEDPVTEAVILQPEEGKAWKSFLDQWRVDAMKADPSRLRTAMIQAAHEIDKALQGIQREQEASALGAGGRLVTRNGAASRRYGGSSSYGATISDVMHERLMNGIYRSHQRRMNRILRIRGRRF